MNIFVTGLPRSGKSTLIENVLEQITGSKKGFITREMRQNDDRVGFELITSDSSRYVLAHTSISSAIQVSRYFVDTSAVESAINSLSSFSSNDLLYIDEIGQMELYSEKFPSFVRSYLDANNVFIGSLSQVYNNPFIDEIKSRKDVVLYSLTPENRDVTFTQVLEHVKELI